MRWWPWSRRRQPENGATAKAREQEWKLRLAQAETPMYERLAPDIARLPDDEFAARVRDAFRRRPA